MAGLVDMPTSWELVGATKQVIMQDERNIERSSPDWSVSFPRDFNIADDKNEEGGDFIKQVQTFMKTGPLGAFKYTGPVDGIISDHLRYTLIQFGWKLRDKTGKSIQLVSGNTISPSKFQEAMKLLKDTLKPKKDKEDKPNDTIASFQRYFKSFGLYSGNTDGNPTPKELESLGSSAKKLENGIAKAINNDEVIGKLWNSSSNTFNTTVRDLQQALLTIIKHRKKGNKEEKIATLSENDRFLALAYFAISF